MNSRKVIFVTFFLSFLVSVFCAPIDKSSDNDEIYRSALENPNLFGGDIVLPEANYKFGVKPTYFRWPNNTIPYTISYQRMSLKEQIENAMKHIENKTCIRFVPHTTETDLIHIFYGPGCFSYPGRQGGRQFLSLGRGCEPFGTIVHELMHAIGFFHQHQRTDRDYYLNIHWENINPRVMNQFTVLSEAVSVNYAAFDYNSIMLYDSTTFSRNGRQTMTARNPRIPLRPVWLKKYLSESDITSINRMYDCTV